jgi:hypothetical protein
MAALMIARSLSTARRQADPNCHSLAVEGRPGRTYVPGMPGTAQAALVFLVIVVPGFLAMAGYRLGRAVPDHSDGLIGTARVIAVSAFIAVIAWKLGGRDLFRDIRSGKALTAHEAGTYQLAVELLLIPGVVGFLIGQLVQAVTRRLSDALIRARQDPGDRSVWLKRLLKLAARLLPDDPTAWESAWNQVRRNDRYVFVRVTTKGGRELVGVISDDSKIALSPRPRDIYIEQILRKGTDGVFYATERGLGVFVTGSEIESVEWISRREEGEPTHA